MVPRLAWTNKLVNRIDKGLLVMLAAFTVGLLLRADSSWFWPAVLLGLTGLGAGFFNAPNQTVVSGDPPAVARAGEGCKARGAKRVIPLKVSGAFHSPLMAGAAEGLGAALDRTTIVDARTPVIANVSASPVRTATEIRAALKAQLLGAVRWQESLGGMLASGVDGFIEVGTGKVLRGLLRTLDRNAPSWNVEDPASLTATLEALGVRAAGA